MESIARKPFQGVLNIIRFNWQYYALALLFISGLFVSGSVLSGYSFAVNILTAALAAAVLLSLLVSHIVYDRSNLYSLDFLERLPIREGDRLLNINAGFDEISTAITLKYPYVELRVLDFYEAGKHTESSIRRARKMYPSYPGTRRVISTAMELEPGSTDLILLIFAAHEIRDEEERITFFKQLACALKEGGRVLVMEHLRNPYNFLAYNIGFMHFYSRKTWLQTFAGTELKVVEEFRHTPFVSGFILEKNGASS
jgi:hypothetical protein